MPDSNRQHRNHRFTILMLPHIAGPPPPGEVCDDCATKIQQCTLSAPSLPSLQKIKKFCCQTCSQINFDSLTKFEQRTKHRATTQKLMNGSFDGFIFMAGKDGTQMRYVICHHKKDLPPIPGEVQLLLLCPRMIYIAHLFVSPEVESNFQ